MERDNTLSDTLIAGTTLVHRATLEIQVLAFPRCGGVLHGDAIHPGLGENLVANV